MQEAHDARRIRVKEYKGQGRGVLNFRIDSIKPPPKKAPKRGKCRGMSDRSKKRVNDLVQIIDYEGMTEHKKKMPLFITLTYPEVWPSDEQAKKHLNLFLRRIIEKRFKNGVAVWKQEYQKRGAIHFHIMLFGVPFIHKDDVNNWWGKIVGKEYWDYSQESPRPPITQVKRIQSTNGCAFYTAKYVAKNDGSQGELSEPARAAGFNCLPYLPLIALKEHEDIFSRVIERANADGIFFESDCLVQARAFLEYVIPKYLTEDERDIVEPPTGRIWGVRNKKLLKTYPCTEKAFQYDARALQKLKEYCSALRLGVSFHHDNPDGGFTLYFNSETERLWTIKVLEHWINETKKGV